MNPSPAVIEVEAVRFSYGGPLVLDGIDLCVTEGEFLGLVGPNAGGKSTLLKLLLGLIAPSAGRIRVFGQAPVAARHLLGYVPHYPSFPRDFPISVEQTVLMGRIGRTRQSGWLDCLRPGGYSRTDIAAAHSALTEVEADDLRNRQIGSLSGGQLQRVLLARALVSEPRLLILDEPTANIDQRLENDIFELLKQLNRRLTILVVSHDIGFISAYVNRVACINHTLMCHHTDAIDGQIIQNLYEEDVRMVAHQH